MLGEKCVCGGEWRQQGSWHLCMQMTERCELQPTGVHSPLWCLQCQLTHIHAYTHDKESTLVCGWVCVRVRVRVCVCMYVYVVTCLHMILCYGCASAVPRTLPAIIATFRIYRQTSFLGTSSLMSSFTCTHARTRTEGTLLNNCLHNEYFHINYNLDCLCGQ